MESSFPSHEQTETMIKPVWDIPSKQCFYYGYVTSFMYHYQKRDTRKVILCKFASLTGYLQGAPSSSLHSASHHGVEQSRKASSEGDDQGYYQAKLQGQQVG